MEVPRLSLQGYSWMGVCLYTDGSAGHACVDGMKELPIGLGCNYTEVK